jgi:hypothetical protein
MSNMWPRDHPESATLHATGRDLQRSSVLHARNTKYTRTTYLRGNCAPAEVTMYDAEKTPYFEFVRLTLNTGATRAAGAIGLVNC